MPLVYLSFCLSVVIGIFVRNRQSPGPLSIATLLGATQFFLITNLAMWSFGTTYPKSLEGPLNCYTAGIPLFGNTLTGDAFYAFLLFGKSFRPFVLYRAGYLEVTYSPGWKPGASQSTAALLHRG